MMNKELQDYIREKIDGLEVAIECEKAVVDHLESARLRFHTGDRAPGILRKVRALCTSRGDVDRFQKELDVWRQVSVALLSEEVLKDEPKEVPKPTRGERSIPWELR
jgi:hypothetical protein